ncbi:MAG: hypothetical protein CHACPFDD_00905 [Phycisphaerae bacterium]|nr:hypothetical protein [Phycisphaerae bacterium]
MMYILKPSGETGRDNVWFPSRGHILKVAMQTL